MTLTITVFDDNGDEHEIEVPTIKAVCPDCKGEGKRIHQAFRDQAFTQGDADREGLDYHDEIESMVSGRYDVVCETCKGLRVMDVPDRDSMDAETLALLQEHEDNQQIEREQRAAELRWGY